jgi:hypothetical protein
MKWYKVKEAAELLEISHTSVHNKLKKFMKPLQGHFKKENKTTYLDKVAINFMKNTLKPSDTKEKKPHKVDESLPTPFLTNLQDELLEKKEIIKDLLETQKELIKNDSEARKRHDTIIMTLTQQIQNQSIQLEDLRTKKEEVPKPKKINKIFKQEIKIQEPESKPTFKQKIVYFFKPHLQRKRA